MQGCLSRTEAAGGGPWPCRSPARGGPTSHAGLKAQGRGQVSPSESRPTKGRHRCPTPEGGPPRPEFGTATVQGPGSVEMVGPVLFLDSEAAADGDWRGPGGPDLPSAPSLTTGQRQRSACQWVRHLLSPSLSPTVLFKESAGRV